MDKIRRSRYVWQAEAERVRKEQRVQDFVNARFMPDELETLADIYRNHREIQELARSLDLSDPGLTALCSRLDELFTAPHFDPTRYAVYVNGIQSKAFHSLLAERGLTQALTREEAAGADNEPKREETEKTALGVMEAYRETFIINLEPVDLLAFHSEFRSAV